MDAIFNTYFYGICLSYGLMAVLLNLFNMLNIRMKVVEVRGKSTRSIRKVYILITPEMVRAIKYVCEKRQQDSPFVISPLSYFYIFSRGCYVIEYFLCSCCATGCTFSLDN